MHSDSAQTIPVTVIVLTLNEAMNLPHCLGSLGGFREVIVLDSFSADETEAICAEHGATFVQNEFLGFGTQRNWALDNLPVTTDWILFLDADERVPEALAMEIRDRVGKVPDSVGAFRMRRRFHMWGRWLKHSSLYPTWVVRLVRKDKVRYVNRGHAETQSVDGTILDLENDLIDENHKGMDEWFTRQNRYSTRDAAYELETEAQPLSIGNCFSRDPLVRRAAVKRIACVMPARPLVYFLYSYIWKKGFLDGRDGFVFCRMRALYQGMVVAKKHDLRRGG